MEYAYAHGQRHAHEEGVRAFWFERLYESYDCDVDPAFLPFPRALSRCSFELASPTLRAPVHHNNNLPPDCAFPILVQPSPLRRSKTSTFPASRKVSTSTTFSIESGSKAH